uniref:Flavoprotein wrbA n=1 Tax=Anthurium amnicola TaxID=1678845 RepID=A0A1D1YZJ9_9ARAE
MSSSSKSSGNKRDAGLNSPNKVKTLNPNAAEYVPSAFRSLPGNNSEVDVALLKVPGISRNAVLDRSVSDISIKSDDEAHEYWRHQLPDDITPDFKVMEEELQAPGGLSLAGLSINDGIETSRFPSTMGNQHLGKCQENSLRRSGYKCLNERMGYSGLPYTEDHSSTARMNLSTNPLDKQYINGDEHLNSNREGGYYGGNSNAGFLNGLLSERAMLENATMNPVALLASKFPGLAAESLEELYHANRCDLNLTIEYIEMHTQLKVCLACLNFQLLMFTNITFF